MVTSETAQDLVLQAIRAGATDYIVKPLTADSFTKKIRALNEFLKRSRPTGG